MMKDYFSIETAKIRELISKDPSYSELSDDNLKERAEQMYQERLRQGQQEDVETTAFFSSFNFFTRKSLIDTVF